VASTEFSATAHGNPPKTEERKRAELYARCLLGSCAACGVSGFDADLSPVDDDDLTYFVGDELCHECK
jgi:hypothetical protein